MKRLTSPAPQQSSEKKVKTLQANHVNPKRVRLLNRVMKPAEKGTVVYWMSRDQRVHDNWALLYAQELAEKNKMPLAVLFCWVPSFLGATLRQYGFMIKGLRDVDEQLKALNIPFCFEEGESTQVVPAFAKKVNAAHLVCDFSPLKIGRHWRDSVAKSVEASNVRVHEVDAHNVVPAWVASDKMEWAARTIRNKVHKQLPEFLEDFPEMKKSELSNGFPTSYTKFDFDSVYKKVQSKVESSVAEVDWIQPGEKAARQHLDVFLEKRLRNYCDTRNDPSKDGLSNFSPYLHYGHICTQTIILRAKANRSKYAPSFDAFLEESVVRKELAENFCLYNPNYDSVDGFPDWAKKTLEDHEKDKREFVYSLEQWEKAETHDRLWNASQLEMVKRGKMHGFMRMYWCKKILEWSESPKEALRIAIYLNDRYELDGRDPNGYVGCAWSIGGVHDQGWAERAVFGKVRYMNFEGCKRKFDVEAYIAKHGSGKAYDVKANTKTTKQSSLKLMKKEQT